MNRVKLLLLTIFVFNLYLNARSQAIEIDSKLPELQFSQLLNVSQPVFQFSDLNKKLIIIDLWNLRCGSCIEALPKLEKLQQEFNEDIDIVLINPESRDSTINFFKSKKKLSIPSLKMITGDTVFLRRLSPYSYPCVIWLDSNLVVRHITGGYNVTREHIASFIKAQPLKMKNVATHIDYGSLVDGIHNNLNHSLEYYSYLARCNDTLLIGNSSGEYVDDKKAIRMSCNCCSVVDLYKKAFSEYDKYDFNTSYGMELKVKDTFKYVFPDDRNLIDSWMEQYSYNYETLIPEQTAVNKYKFMQADLEKYFGLKAGVEMRVMDVLVLVRKGNTDKLKTGGGNPFDNFYETVYEGHGDAIINVINRPFEYFARWLGITYRNFIPFYDETGYKGDIDIKIRKTSLDRKNLPELRRDLNRYGIDIIREKRKVPVLVLSDNI